jgi:hypothetical protein
MSDNKSSPAAKTIGWKYDLVLSYALGNLALLPFWFIAFARNGMPLDQKFIEHFYELSQIFDYVDYFSALLLGLIIGAVLFAILRIVANHRPQIYNFIVGFFVIPPFAGSLAIAWYLVFPPSGHARLNHGWVFEGAAVLGLTVALILIGIALRGKGVLQLVRSAVSITAPIGLVLTINAYAAYEKTAPAHGGLFHVDRSLAPLQDKKINGPRVVLIFFDYWDYHYTFVRRPNFVKTPNIDNLTNISFNGHNVARTSSKTFAAIPSTLSGHRIDYARRIAGDRLLTQYAAEYYPRIWNNQETMFSDARNAGYNVGVVATAFHPVCRMFRQYISRCVIDDHPFDYKNRTVLNRLDNVVTSTLWQVPPIRRVLFGERKIFHSHWGIHLKLSNIDSLKKSSINPKISFLYSHLFIPHAPNIWNSIKKEYMYENEDDPKNYFHSIVFLDKVIGELRAELEKAGLWDKTALILTADTGNVGGQAGSGLKAYKEWGYDKKNRVPLIIRLPGQKHRVDLHRRVSGQTLRRVIQQIFAGKITKPEQISDHMTYIDYMY